MADRPDRHDAPATRDPVDRSASEVDQLGLGARDSVSSNTGPAADTSHGARDSQPYTSGEPRGDTRDAAARDGADADVPGPDEP